MRATTRSVTGAPWWKPCRVHRDGLLPLSGWLRYGVGEGTSNPNIPEQYFVLLWLPSYGYEFLQHHYAYVWCQRGILWCGVDGFKMIMREVADG